MSSLIWDTLQHNATSYTDNKIRHIVLFRQKSSAIKKNIGQGYMIATPFQRWFDIAYNTHSNQ